MIFFQYTDNQQHNPTANKISWDSTFLMQRIRKNIKKKQNVKDKLHKNHKTEKLIIYVYWFQSMACGMSWKKAIIHCLCFSIFFILIYMLLSIFLVKIVSIYHCFLAEFRYEYHFVGCWKKFNGYKKNLPKLINLVKIECRKLEKIYVFQIEQKKMFWECCRLVPCHRFFGDYSADVS